MYHFLLPDATRILTPLLENVRLDPFFASSLRRSEVSRPHSADGLRLLRGAAEEAVGGGEPRERRALDLRLSEGVSGEEEGRLLRG